MSIVQLFVKRDKKIIYQLVHKNIAPLTRIWHLFKTKMSGLDFPGFPDVSHNQNFAEVWLISSFTKISIIQCQGIEFVRKLAV